MPTPSRLDAMKTWLTQVVGQPPATLEAAAADASVRRYWRATWPERSLIVMEADPAQFDCQPFLLLRERLETAGLPVPHCLAVNDADGFVLLEDLGDQTLTPLLADETAAQSWYRKAIDLLIAQQTNTPVDGLPVYDSAFLQRELEICREWYFGQQLGIELDSAALAVWQRSCALIVATNLQQAQVFVHRDFHSRNLMVKDGELRLIDFQDAVAGPISYDLVSLLRDAYIEWNEAFVLDLAIRYWEQARAAGLPVDDDFATFYRAFEWQGLQRHIKVLGIFARLKYRDGKDGYQADIPRVLAYVKKVCERYGELAGLRRLLRDVHQEVVEVGYTF